MSDEIVELRKDIIALKEENAKLKKENETLRMTAEKSKCMQQNPAELIIAKKPMEKRFFKNWLLFDSLPWINRKELANSSMSTASEAFRQLCWPKLHQNVESHEIKYLKFSPAQYELGILRPLVHMNGVIVPIASIPPPEYITGIKEINLDFVNEQIVDFFKSIASLLEKCDIHFNIYKMDKKQQALIHALLQCLADKIFQIYHDSHFNKFEQLFPGIYVHVQYIWWDTNAHDQDIDFILNWLAKPSKSGKQKKLFISGNGSTEMTTFINRIKEFNQPTAQMPKQILPNKVNFTDRPFQENVAIYENFTITLNGIINPDAKNMKFEIVDQLDHGYMRFIVDFEKNSITFEGKIKSIPMNHFARGAPFNLVVIMTKDGISFNVNCNGHQYLEAQIVFENPHYINITGDYKYINADLGDASASSRAMKSWMFEEGLHGNNSGGIMLQGKISENAEKFTIKLWHRNDDGSYESILNFEIDIGPRYHRLLIGPKNEDCQKLDVPNKKCNMENVTLSYKADSKFEAIFKFSVFSEKIEIWMDNILIGDKKISSNDIISYANAIHFVQIVGNASANMTKIRRNFVECPYEMPKNSLKIVGKMLPSKISTKFFIDFFIC